MNENKLRDFFWFCAGVDKELLLECNTGHAKYAAIGATVFFTALFASLSGGYALYFVFSGSEFAVPIAIAFGLLWGLAIFNIDRYLIISIKKEGKVLKEIFTASPRLLLAIMIGIVIARPLEMKIFDKEIRKERKEDYLINQENLNRKTNENFETRHKGLIAHLKEKKEDRRKAEELLRTAEDIRDAECLGKASSKTTGIYGRGPQCADRENEVEKKEDDYNSISVVVDSLEHRLEKIRIESGLTIIENLNDRILDSIVNNTGFYDRNKALSKLSSWTPWSGKKNKENEFPSIGDNKEQKSDGTVFFISLLFIIFESLPIIVKLMSGRGDYDIKLEDEEDKLRFLSKNETLANKFLIKELSIAQREVLREAINRWRENELNKEDLSDGLINFTDET